MNRTGLAIALAVAVVVGVLFGVDPQLDIDIAALFYDPAVHRFSPHGWDWVGHARDAAFWLITLMVAPAFLAVAGKLIMPRRRMLIASRAALFLIVTLLLGPFLLTNVVLKDHWGRVRPTEVPQFGGKEQYTAWWDARGLCRDNCSFVAGEPSAAFWTFAPAALAPPQWRLLAYAGVLIFGATMGVLRMAGGAHFFSDVVFAGVLMFLVVWTMHGLIYRWRRTRLTDAEVERPLERAGKALREVFAALARRVAGRNSQRS